MSSWRFATLMPAPVGHVLWQRSHNRLPGNRAHCYPSNASSPASLNGKQTEPECRLKREPEDHKEKHTGLVAEAIRR